MTFKPTIWFPIALLLGLINLVAVGFAVNEPVHATTHAALAVAFGLWAQYLRRGRTGVTLAGPEVARLQEQLDQQMAVLQDTQALLDTQVNQLAELQERMDFAERVLAQARDRQTLGPHDERG